MKLKIVVAILKTDKPVEEDAAKLRGYIGRKYPDEVLLHHHTEEGSLYTYPRIQYKIIEKTPIIVGIDEGAPLLKSIVDEIDVLKLGKRSYRVESIQMNQFNADFGKTRKYIKYKFLTPWLALNQKNYEKFKETKDWKKRKEFLNGILVGNVLSISKSLGYFVKGKLHAHSLLYRTSVEYKAIPHIGFTGEFKINFNLPDYIGVGKGVSHGFGTIRRMKINDKKKT